MSNFKFPKSERICDQTLISEIFDKGKTTKEFPLFVHYLNKDFDGKPLQVLFSVSKKNFKSAIKRNLLKRRMREAYRLNKNILIPLLENSGKSMKIAFVYAGKEIFSFKQLEKKIITILGRLSEMHEKGLC